ncbi:aminoglycoside phosphotransferase family protein [Nocardia yamanashiensis]|uniref:aminoglycoside phosphotransferase family protein n=1 Tax=Nocardia yamanashiensis TaxID=209247 RepID=UPI001E5C5598|nr:aminoglycoside phosphotransferase family protein [Nocardia yamanashiensis]UGT41898.1 aminoglycoside phosphotransferase family protein [Nocardia yamanashiensis]
MPNLLPEDVAENIAEVFEERGRRWLAELPGVIEERCGAWGLRVTGKAFGGGTHSFVAPVERADGSVAVLKVPVVDPENLGEAAALHCYGGDGAVRLFEFDAESHAMLLEWARPGTELLYQPGFPSLEGRAEHIGKVEQACALYRRLRREPGTLPDGLPPLPPAAGMVAEWVEMFTEPEADVAEHLPERLRERALERCAELAVPDGPLLVVNRDTHLGNIVAAEREPWLLIDPKGYLGEAAFDAGFLVMIQVQSAPEPEHARAVVERTAAALGVAADRARAWAFMRAMEEVVWAVEDEEPEDLRLHLAVAAALA